MYKSDTEKKQIIKNIDKLCKWLSYNYDIETYFSIYEENGFDGEEKSIYINTRANYRSQLYTLLHEAGHAILSKNKSVYQKNFPLSHKENRKGIEARVDTLREEVIAWEEGLNIAKIVKIPINRKYYDKYTRSALWSYIKWAKDPMHWRT